MDGGGELMGMFCPAVVDGDDMAGEAGFQYGDIGGVVCGGIVMQHVSTREVDGDLGTGGGSCSRVMDAVISVSICFLVWNHLVV